MITEKTEEIISELVMRVATYFKLDAMEALSAVASSRLANKLSREGNQQNLTIDELSERIYAEISRAE